jgi:hypothetical protein
MHRRDTQSTLLAEIDAEVYREARRDTSEDTRFAGPFFTRGGCTYRRLVKERGGERTEEDVLVAMFEATILEQRIHDDGLSEDTVFLISGSCPTGALAEMEVPASRFAAMGWVVEAWGNHAVLMPGHANKDAMRAAVQLLSSRVPTIRIYQHTGWRRIGAEHVYLHSGGALGAHGNDVTVAVDLQRYDPSGRMAAFHTPAPPDDASLRDAVEALLGVVGLSKNPALGYLMLAMVGRAPLSAALPPDFAAHLAGATGNFKSEAAALVQACFGPKFSARSLAATWDDTVTNLVVKAHAAKDAVLVVDDFRPKGTPVDVARLHADADRLIRAAGNQAGRGRQAPNMRAQVPYYPRALLLSTGEDTPQGHSLRARLLTYEIDPGEIRTPVLTNLQKHAAAGVLAEATAGYIQWLAPVIGTKAAELRRDLESLRGVITFDHARGVDIYGNLWLGLRHFLDFAGACGALSPDAVADHKRDGDAALRGLLQDQGDLHQDSDEVAVFLEALRACFVGGRVHVCSSDRQGPPVSMAHIWGWRNGPGRAHRLGGRRRRLPGDGAGVRRRPAHGQRVGNTDHGRHADIVCPHARAWPVGTGGGWQEGLHGADGHCRATA